MTKLVSKNDYMQTSTGKVANFQLPEVEVTAKSPTGDSWKDRNLYQAYKGRRYINEGRQKAEPLVLGLAGLTALPGITALAPAVSTTLNNPYVNAVLTADGVRNALSGEGVQKTYRLAKEGDYWGATKSGVVDALNLWGCYGLLKNRTRALKLQQSPFNLSSQKIQDVNSHLQGEDAVQMFKQYGGIKIPNESINGEQLRKYVQEARLRYGLVGNKNITDEEIAQALYKHSQELGKGSAAINAQGEPQLLFRGDTQRYTKLKPRMSPEELEKASGTMDNSLGNLFLGELPATSITSGAGLERYVAHVRDFRGNKRLVGSGTGSKVVTPDGTKIREFSNDEIGIIPEGSYQLASYQTRAGENNIYKLPASWTESGVNDINAFIVRTPKVRDSSKEISVLNDDFLVQGGSKVSYYGPVNDVGTSERAKMAKHYREVLNKAQDENQGLLKSNKGSYLRDEHEGYDYFALPNFNIKNAKHLLPYDLRIPRNWNNSNIYKTTIPVGVSLIPKNNNTQLGN